MTIKITNFHRSNSDPFTEENYDQYIGDALAHVLIGGGLSPYPKFEDGHVIRDSVDHQQLDIYFEGVGTTILQLPADFKLPTSINDMDTVELINPRAYYSRKRRTISVKAEGLKEVK